MWWAENKVRSKELVVGGDKKTELRSDKHKKNNPTERNWCWDDEKGKKWNEMKFEEEREEYIIWITGKGKKLSVTKEETKMDVVRIKMGREKNVKGKK